MNSYSLPKLTMVLLLMLILTGISFSQDSDKLTIAEKQKVGVFAASVYKKLRQTRDVSIFLNQPPASLLIDKKLNDIFKSGDLIEKDVLKNADTNDLKEYWIQLNNLLYLGQIYSYSKFENSNSDSERLTFPKHISTFMDKNSVVRICRFRAKTDDDKDDCIIGSVIELKKEIAVYKQVSAMMRKYFILHPPEKTFLYRKNISPREAEVKYFTVDECSAEYAKDLCFVLSPGSKIITLLSNLPIGMILAETDGKLKVLMFGGAD